ncbi:MAG: hypothetical protein NVS2B16_19160 [Chloroflexota bacterium]
MYFSRYVSYFERPPREMCDVLVRNYPWRRAYVTLCAIPSGRRLGSPASLVGTPSRVHRLYKLTDRERQMSVDSIVVLDVDGADDPTHGNNALLGYGQLGGGPGPAAILRLEEVEAGQRTGSGGIDEGADAADGRARTGNLIQFSVNPEQVLGPGLSSVCRALHGEVRVSDVACSDEQKAATDTWAGEPFGEKMAGEIGVNLLCRPGGSAISCLLHDGMQCARAGISAAQGIADADAGTVDLESGKAHRILAGRPDQP